MSGREGNRVAKGADHKKERMFPIMGIRDRRGQPKCTGEEEVGVGAEPERGKRAEMGVMSLKTTVWRPAGKEREVFHTMETCFGTPCHTMESGFGGARQAAAAVWGDSAGEVGSGACRPRRRSRRCARAATSTSSGPRAATSRLIGDKRDSGTRPSGRTSRTASG